MAVSKRLWAASSFAFLVTTCSCIIVFSLSIGNGDINTTTTSPTTTSPTTAPTVNGNNKTGISTTSIPLQIKYSHPPGTTTTTTSATSDTTTTTTTTTSTTSDTTTTTTTTTSTTSASGPLCWPRPTFTSFARIRQYVNDKRLVNLDSNINGTSLRVYRCHDFLSPCNDGLSRCIGAEKKNASATMRLRYEDDTNRYIFLSLKFIEDKTCKCVKDWQFYPDINTMSTDSLTALPLIIEALVRESLGWIKYCKLFSIVLFFPIIGLTKKKRIIYKDGY